MRKREGRERKEREKMREREREIVGLKQFESIKKKKNIPFSYSTILHLRCTVAICQKIFGLFTFGRPIAGIFWACMPNVSYIWHM